eukprot:RCo000925
MSHRSAAPRPAFGRFSGNPYRPSDLNQRLSAAGREQVCPQLSGPHPSPRRSPRGSSLSFQSPLGKSPRGVSPARTRKFPSVVGKEVSTEKENVNPLPPASQDLPSCPSSLMACAADMFPIPQTTGLDLDLDLDLASCPVSSPVSARCSQSQVPTVHLEGLRQERRSGPSPFMSVWAEHTRDSLGIELQGLAPGSLSSSEGRGSGAPSMDAEDVDAVRQLEEFVKEGWDQLHIKEKEVSQNYEEVIKAERDLQQRRLTLQQMQDELRVAERAVQSRQTFLLFHEAGHSLAPGCVSSRESTRSSGNGGESEVINRGAAQVPPPTEGKDPDPDLAADTADSQLRAHEKAQARRSAALDQQESEQVLRATKLERTEMEMEELEQWHIRWEREVRARKELFEKAQRADQAQQRLEQLEAQLRSSSCSAVGSRKADASTLATDEDNRNGAGILGDSLEASQHLLQVKAENALLLDRVQRLEAEVQLRQDRDSPLPKDSSTPLHQWEARLEDWRNTLRARAARLVQATRAGRHSPTETDTAFSGEQANSALEGTRAYSSGNSPGIAKSRAGSVEVSAEAELQLRCQSLRADLQMQEARQQELEAVVLQHRQQREEVVLLLGRQADALTGSALKEAAAAQSAALEELRAR